MQVFIGLCGKAVETTICFYLFLVNNGAAEHVFSFQYRHC